MTATTATPGIGHNARPLPPVGHPIWPDGAEAVIARRKRPVWTSGQARTGEWVLRFERRTPPFIEPLMGWTGGDDTLAQVELSFRSRDEAIAYAERQGLAIRVEKEPMTPVQMWSEHRRRAAEERQEERQVGGPMPAKSFPRPRRPRPSSQLDRRREWGGPVGKSATDK
jgi:ETC complex I subunit conserved region